MNRLVARAAAAGAAAVAAIVLLGWATSLEGLTSWGGRATSPPWTATGLLLVGGALLSGPRLRPWLAGAAVWATTTALVGAEVVAGVQRAVVGTGDPSTPAFGVELALLLLALAAWSTVVEEVLRGLPTALAAGAVSVVVLALIGRWTGEVWLASGGEPAAGAMSIPTLTALVLLATAVGAGDTFGPVSIGQVLPRPRRWLVAIGGAVVVPALVSSLQPPSTPRGAGAYATTALLVVAGTMAVQLAALATNHRGALATVTTLVEVMPDATLLVDDRGGVVLANGAAAIALGWDRTDLATVRADELLPGVLPRVGRAPCAVDDGWRQSGSVPRGDEITVRRHDGGSFPARLWLTPVELQGRRLTLVTVHDVSAEREQVEQLAALQEMQDVFLMAVSHELRTPLTVVAGIADTLAAEGPRVAPDQRALLLERMTVQTGRLQRLLAELLDVERIRRGVAGETGLVDIADVVASQVRRSAEERGLEVTMVVTPEVPLVKADRVLLERVVDNLLSNSAKYAPGRVEVHVHPHADGVVLSVDDHGPGVPEDLRDQVFRPFHRGDQLDPATPGVGIGLALAAGLAAASGGRAWVQDRDDGEPGASFRLHLPAATVESAPAVG